MTTTSSRLLQRALDGHGGRERWEAASEASAHIRCGGIALRSKLAAGPLREYDATVSVKEPRTVIEPYPRTGLRGVFEGDRVRIENVATGATVSERANPRERFPGGMRAIRWDRLDALYFAGYALWNYLTFPYVLTHDGVETRDGGEWVESPGERWARLDATFPDGFPTHSREQSFYLDGEGRLRRLDYTAEVFGRWAKAAHVCLAHEISDGIPVPVRRRVTPRRPDGRPRRLPVLVSLELDSVRLR
jgi:hypothetical protein